MSDFLFIEKGLEEFQENYIKQLKKRAWLKKYD